jgi:hypothetical protein
MTDAQARTSPFTLHLPIAHCEMARTLAVADERIFTASALSIGRPFWLDPTERQSPGSRPRRQAIGWQGREADQEEVWYACARVSAIVPPASAQGKALQGDRQPRTHRTTRQGGKPMSDFQAIADRVEIEALRGGSPTR